MYFCIYQSIYDSVLNTSRLVWNENEKVRNSREVEMSKDFQSWYPVMLITPPHGKTIQGTGMFILEVERALGDQLSYRRGIRFMPCSSELKDKIN